MDLLLWRHAEAVEGTVDMERRLTEKGKKQAKTMADWIIRHAPRDLRVLVSPALRCMQTASALNLPYQEEPRLLPETSIAAMISACGWPDSPTPIIIVGHQPCLGLLASTLLAGHASPWSIKKGALWWISCRTQRGKTETRLLAATTAELAAAPWKSLSPPHTQKF